MAYRDCAQVFNCCGDKLKYVVLLRSAWFEFKTQLFDNLLPKIIWGLRKMTRSAAKMIRRLSKISEDVNTYKVEYRFFKSPSVKLNLVRKVRVKQIPGKQLLVRRIGSFE